MSRQSTLDPQPDLMRTPLYELHVSRRARMAPFAGYEMPIHYPSGVLKEHLHTRAAAGLFDVSHMGQLVIRAKTGDFETVARAFERLTPSAVIGLERGRQRYALLTNAAGGILDDLMIARRDDDLLLIVNAARKAHDEAHLKANLSDLCEIERLDRALLALQGPLAETALKTLASGIETMRFMDVRPVDIGGMSCLISRSGYTGEDGFEISISSDQAAALADALLADPNVALIGLGARDSLRLEAGLCLYGSDLDETTTPVEAGLEWVISRERRSGGSRPGGFPGDGVILEQMRKGTSRRRSGLLPEGRAPMRAGTAIFESPTAGAPVGRVTSGGFGPSLNRPVSMGYIASHLAEAGTVLFAEVRGERHPVRVTDLPFVTPRVKRG